MFNVIAETALQQSIVIYFQIRDYLTKDSNDNRAVHFKHFANCAIIILARTVLGQQKKHLMKWKNGQWPGFEMANKSALKLLKIVTKQFRIDSGIAMVFGHFTAVIFEK